MNFSEQLNEYIKIIKCSAKDLSKSSTLSTAVISRYRSGDRTPSKDSEQLNKLSTGIESLALKNGISNIDRKKVYETLNNLLEGKSNEFYQQLSNNFNELITLLNINMAEMARSLSFDASYLSRIRNGERRPADVNLFIDSVCRFVMRKYQADTYKNIIANLTNCSLKDLNDNSVYVDKLTKWFYSGTHSSPNYVDDFLKKLDDFNLDEYIRIIHFDQLKVPTFPFHFPSSKNYYGIEEMKKGELDFFKATVLSKSTEPMLMCSDMPMEDMAEDVDFGKKWMFAIAMTLKKGLHLNMIHNLDRPFQELMVGFESWIPIYMTGQVSPFYLPGSISNTYCHFNYVSGSVALAGECIKDFHNDGKYYLTNNKEEVNYYKQKAKCLLNKAKPLMEIYRNDSANLYKVFINSNIEKKCNRRAILSAPPIFVLPKKILLNILKNNSISSDDQNKIIKFADEQLNIVTTMLNHSIITNEITELSKEEFENHPVNLSLSGMFYENIISYTYEQYCEHLNLYKEFAEKNKNFNIITSNKNAFRNIQIFIQEGDWVMLSKETNPAIHFVIKNPKLRDAIENFIAPVIE